jgi:hypothetical protein
MPQPAKSLLPSSLPKVMISSLSLALAGARYASRLHICAQHSKLNNGICLQYLKENLDAVKIKLTAEDLAEVRATAQAADAANGDRYPPAYTETLFTDTPELL